jgi:hypothetical protein
MQETLENEIIQNLRVPNGVDNQEIEEKGLTLLVKKHAT